MFTEQKQREDNLAEKNKGIFFFSADGEKSKETAKDIELSGGMIEKIRPNSWFYFTKCTKIRQVANRFWDIKKRSYYLLTAVAIFF